MNSGAPAPRRCEKAHTNVRQTLVGAGAAVDAARTSDEAKAATRCGGVSSDYGRSNFDALTPIAPAVVKHQTNHASRRAGSGGIHTTPPLATTMDCSHFRAFRGRSRAMIRSLDCRAASRASFRGVARLARAAAGVGEGAVGPAARRAVGAAAGKTARRGRAAAEVAARRVALRAALPSTADVWHALAPVAQLLPGGAASGSSGASVANAGLTASSTAANVDMCRVVACGTGARERWLIARIVGPVAAHATFFDAARTKDVRTAPCPFPNGHIVATGTTLALGAHRSGLHCDRRSATVLGGNVVAQPRCGRHALTYAPRAPGCVRARCAVRVDSTQRRRECGANRNGDKQRCLQQRRSDFHLIVDFTQKKKALPQCRPA